MKPVSAIISVLIIGISPLFKLEICQKLYKSNAERTKVNRRIVEIEMFNQMVACAHNLRIQTRLLVYFELYILIVQNLFILLLISGNRHFKLLSLLSVFLLVLLAIDLSILEFLLSLSIPLMLISTFPVIGSQVRWILWSTSRLASPDPFFPFSMLLLGQFMGIGRLVTTYLEVSSADMVILSAAATGPILNLVLVLLHVVYHSCVRSGDRDRPVSKRE